MNEGEAKGLSNLDHPCAGSFLTPITDTRVGGVGEDEVYEKVRFEDNQQKPRGRGRLDLCTGERHF